MKILFVCLGNICRSPMAEGIMRERATKKGFDWKFDSAGTSAWHIGEKPDQRGINVCKRYDIDISSHRARQFQMQDFNEFDLIFAMDKSNFSNLRSLTNNTQYRDKIKLFSNYIDQENNKDIPDPYYDGKFQNVFEMIDKVSETFIEKINLNK